MDTEPVQHIHKEGPVKNIKTTEIVVKQVSIGNQPANARFFSQRPDVQPHFHVPTSTGKTEFFCGKCMFVVRIG
jgi:hypothetical protein